MSTALWYQNFLIIHKIHVDPFLKAKLDGCLCRPIVLELQLLNILKQPYAYGLFVCVFLSWAPSTSII
ncbi:hypothetical protein Meth11DRAFT_2006 [Methylophilaceae bacterium 11]|nr:hypothetical protein Meth11DRAFT_2006 [Methylophilaceae bacterium 11]